VTDGRPQTTDQALKGWYQVAVGLWGMQPSEFWDMTPEEWWWLYETKSALQRKPGAMTQADLDDLERFAAEHGEKYRNL
jgi:hypothetical protein